MTIYTDMNKLVIVTNKRGKQTMSYNYKYENQPIFWVHYRGTRNGAYIRAANHHKAKWLFAEAEGLNSITYLVSTKNRKF